MRDVWRRILLFCGLLVAVGVVIPAAIAVILATLGAVGGFQGIGDTLLVLFFSAAYVFPALAGVSNGVEFILGTWAVVAVAFGMLTRRASIKLAIALGFAVIAVTTVLIHQVILPSAGIHLEFPGDPL
jgi:hypothetical protein